MDVKLDCITIILIGILIIYFFINLIREKFNKNYGCKNCKYENDLQDYYSKFYTKGKNHLGIVMVNEDTLKETPGLGWLP